MVELGFDSSKRYKGDWNEVREKSYHKLQNMEKHPHKWEQTLHKTTIHVIHQFIPFTKYAMQTNIPCRRKSQLIPTLKPLLTTLCTNPKLWSLPNHATSRNLPLEKQTNQSILHIQWWVRVLLWAIHPQLKLLNWVVMDYNYLPKRIWVVSLLRNRNIKFELKRGCRGKVSSLGFVLLCRCYNL